MNKGIIIGVIIALVVVGIAYYAIYSSTEKNEYAPSTETLSQTASPSSTLSSNEQQDLGAQNAEQPGAQAVQQGKNFVPIQGFAFSQKTLSIKKGTTVEWTNEDSAPHTVTSDREGELDSPRPSQGQKYSHTFLVSGTYAYHCTYHSSMKAMVIVE